MRLVSFVRSDGAARVGMLSPDRARVADLTAIGLEDVYAAVPRLPQLERLTSHLTLAPGAVAYGVGNVRLLAPVPYARLVREAPVAVSADAGPARDEPALSFADPAEIAGPGTHVTPGAGDVLGFGVAGVVGTGGRDIEPATVAGHVAGYTLVAEWHDPWSPARRSELVVMGPALVAADAFEENEALTLTVPDGGVRHVAVAGATAAIQRMVVAASSRYTLRPGDIFLHLAGATEVDLPVGERGEIIIDAEWSGALAHTAHRNA